MPDDDLSRLYDVVIRQLRWPPDETDRLWFCSDWAEPHFSREATRRIADLIVSHGGTVPPGYVWDDADLICHMPMYGDDEC
jgi:hypothetical protein